MGELFFLDFCVLLFLGSFVFLPKIRSQPSAYALLDVLLLILSPVMSFFAAMIKFLKFGVYDGIRTHIFLIHGQGHCPVMIHTPLLKLVCVAGFEPTTTRFQGEDSDQTELHTDI